MIDLFQKYLDHYHVAQDALDDKKINELNNPYTLYGIEEFCTELLKRKDKKILIRPDYDVDGVCSGVLMNIGLRQLGFNSEIWYPRTKVGYGLTMSDALKIVEEKPDVEVIVTTDCGIANGEAISWLKEQGIETFVTDHHLGQIHLHPHGAIGVVNPNRVDVEDPTPFKAISGTFIAYKVLQVLYELAGSNFKLESLEPLVVLSTVSDVMPFENENGYLLRKYRHFREKDLLQLKTISDLPEYQAYVNGLLAVFSHKGHTLDVTDIGWRIAPALNSPRRICKDSKPAFEVFTQLSVELATAKYEYVLEVNETRKERTEEIFKEVQKSKNGVVLLFDDDYEGIMGNVSAKLMQQLDKPAVTFLVLGDVYGGSARAPKGYNLVYLLNEVRKKAPHTIVSFGGHSAAAGVSIHKGTVNDFTKAWLEAIEENPPQQLDTKPILPMDLNLLIRSNQLTKFDLGMLMEQLDTLYPFNQHCPEPQFMISINTERDNVQYMKGQHLKVKLGNVLEVIRWNHMRSPRANLEIRGPITTNVWNGNTTYQIISQE